MKDVIKTNTRVLMCDGYYYLEVTTASETYTLHITMKNAKYVSAKEGLTITEVSNITGKII